jgi:hypothetical protein
VEYSGFWAIITSAQSGEKERGYEFKNPKADWRSYDKIILDPVQIWRTKSAKEEGAPIEDLQRVANNFHLILTKELSKDYTMVTDPTTAGPRTLRIQTALTSMEKGGGVMDNITAIVPIGLGIAAAADFITGKPPFVGEVAAEVKIIDARTGQLLAAAVDKRIGGKDIAKLVDSWDDVNKILSLWSKLLAFRLCEARGGRIAFRLFGKLVLWNDCKVRTKVISKDDRRADTTASAEESAIGTAQKIE